MSVLKSKLESILDCLSYQEIINWKNILLNNYKMAGAGRTGKISAVSSINVITNNTCASYIMHAIYIVKNSDDYRTLSIDKILLNFDIHQYSVVILVQVRGTNCSFKSKRI